MRHPRAAVQGHRLGGVLLRRGGVKRLRHPGDPARAGAGGRHGRDRLPHAAVAAGGGAARRRVFSYRQTIHAYPNGGGSYIVSKDNLGVMPGLVAGASLLVDYTLTVAVSIAAGTAAITSAISPLRGHAVATAVVLLALLAIANLRGIRESGQLFAPPTYGYIAIMVVFIGYGVIRTTFGGLDPLPVNHQALNHFAHNGALLGGASLFLLMRAFSSGAIALSGVEAISNGVPAFRPPEPKHAATVLTWTGTILAALFCGVAALALQLRPTLSEDQTILSIMGRAVFGGDSPLYYILQFFTAAILILSANTAFADFPGSPR
ncbi:MAG TPA: amino acid permease [Acidimicrobiales bacterium]